MVNKINFFQMIIVMSRLDMPPGIVPKQCCIQDFRRPTPPIDVFLRVAKVARVGEERGGGGGRSKKEDEKKILIAFPNGFSFKMTRKKEEEGAGGEQGGGKVATLKSAEGGRKKHQ